VNKAQPQVTNDGGMMGAGTPPAPDRRVAGAVTGVWAAAVLAALAGAAVTIVARGDLATGDLSSSLGPSAAAAAYATLGALIVRRAGNLIGWVGPATAPTAPSPRSRSG
jgi:hypothetical protein